MTDALPARLSDEGRTATWNPALTRAAHVTLRVRRADGTLEERRSMNSGRARVREDERIEAVLASEVE
jgi:predicted transcriptional regulator